MITFVVDDLFIRLLEKRIFHCIFFPIQRTVDPVTRTKKNRMTKSTPKPIQFISNNSQVMADDEKDYHRADAVRGAPKKVTYTNMTGHRKFTPLEHFWHILLVIKMLWSVFIMSFLLVIASDMAFNEEIRWLRPMRIAVWIEVAVVGFLFLMALFMNYKKYANDKDMISQPANSTVFDANLQAAHQQAASTHVQSAQPQQRGNSSEPGAARMPPHSRKEVKIHRQAHATDLLSKYIAQIGIFTMSVIWLVYLAQFLDVTPGSRLRIDSTSTAYDVFLSSRLMLLVFLYVSHFMAGMLHLFQEITHAKNGVPLRSIFKGLENVANSTLGSGPGSFSDSVIPHSGESDQYFSRSRDRRR